MRSDRIATCTSGEPVSSGFNAYSPISACLRSGVIDIGFSLLAIDDAHRPKRAVLDPHQGDGKPILPRADERPVGNPIGVNRIGGETFAQAGAAGFAAPGAIEPLRLPSRRAPGCRPAPSRSAGGARKRPDYARASPPVPAKSPAPLLSRPTRSRRSLAIWPDVPERDSEIAGQRADVGAGADLGLEIGMIRVRHIEQPKMGDLDLGGRPAPGSRRRGPAQGAPSGDLDRRIGRRKLQNHPDKARQGREHASFVRPHGGSAIDPAFAVVGIGRDAPADAEAITLLAGGRELRGLGRLAERQRQHPGRGERVERAGMSDLCYGGALDRADDPRRRDPGRFVDNQPAGGNNRLPKVLPRLSPVRSSLRKWITDEFRRSAGMPAAPRCQVRCEIPRGTRQNLAAGRRAASRRDWRPAISWVHNR